MPEKPRRIAPEPEIPAAPKEAPAAKGIKWFLIWMMLYVPLKEDNVYHTVFLCCHG